MPIVRVPNAGSVGLIKDLSQHELPINAWTDARNICFENGYARQQYGYGQVYDTPAVTPYHVLPVLLADGTRYWVYAGLTAIHGVTITGGAVSSTDLSGATYGATANSWTSTIIGGLPILNNGVDVPLYWNLSTGSNFASLSNWPAANYFCKAMRSFRNILVALGVTEAGTYYPYMIRTSHPADPGALPTSWDHTDTTKDTQRFEVAQARSPLVDGCQLGDSLIAATEKELFRIDYTGGQFITRTTKVLSTSGVMNRNCMVEIEVKGVPMLLALTGSDVIVHDGQNARSILDKKTRRDLFLNIDVDYAYLCFVFKHPFLNQAYICYPQIGSTACDRALAYNYDDDTVSPRDMPNIFHAADGSVDDGLSGIIDSDNATIDSDNTAIDGPVFVPAIARVMTGGSGPKFYQLDSSTDADGSLVSAYLERRGLSLGIPERRKLVREVRPRIYGNTGETVIVRVGSQNDINDDPTWQSRTFTIGSTVSNSFLVDGRYIAIRFETGTATFWRLDSYDILADPSGPW